MLDLGLGRGTALVSRSLGCDRCSGLRLSAGSRVSQCHSVTQEAASQKGDGMDLGHQLYVE
jgi:hypothetical protein